MKLLMASLSALLCFSVVQASQYSLRPADNADTVYFESTARLEFIKGKSTDIAGYFDVDPASPGSGISGRLRVDLRTLRTGIDKRDEHMREKHLQTEEYPFAFFDLEHVDDPPARFESDRQYELSATGRFYIHGVNREVGVKLLITNRIDADGSSSISARALFSIVLDDFNIPRPRALFMKLAETIKVEVFFTGHSGVPAAGIELPLWPLLH
ncbi:MAG: YceI family protein [Candidatus Zixiibacteriota bacterium]